MKLIGILSDTHGLWDDRYETYLGSCDEIWHAGDIGSSEILEKLGRLSKVRAVFGNIDGSDIRMLCPEVQRFEVEGASVMMKHIGGYPGHYDASIREAVCAERPKLFVSGHSHILKVLYDKKLELLHVNPGAAGKQGWQKVRTLVRMRIHEGTFSDMEVIELKD